MGRRKSGERAGAEGTPAYQRGEILHEGKISPGNFTRREEALLFLEFMHEHYFYQKGKVHKNSTEQ